MDLLTTAIEHKRLSKQIPVVKHATIVIQLIVDAPACFDFLATPLSSILTQVTQATWREALRIWKKIVFERTLYALHCNISSKSLSKVFPEALSTMLCQTRLWWPR